MILDVKAKGSRATHTCMAAVRSSCREENASSAQTRRKKKKESTHTHTYTHIHTHTHTHTHKTVRDKQTYQTTRPHVAMNTPTANRAKLTQKVFKHKHKQQTTNKHNNNNKEEKEEKTDQAKKKKHHHQHQKQRPQQQRREKKKKKKKELRVAHCLWRFGTTHSCNRPNRTLLWQNTHSTT